MKQELDTYKKYNNIMLKILQFQNVDAKVTQMPEWLDMLISASKTGYTKICLVAVDVFIKILSFNDKQGHHNAGVIMHIQRLIADSRNETGKLT